MKAFFKPIAFTVAVAGLFACDSLTNDTDEILLRCGDSAKEGYRL